MLFKEHDKEDNSCWGRIVSRVYESLAVWRTATTSPKKSVSKKLCLPAEIIRPSAKVDALGYLCRTPLLAMFSPPPHLPFGIFKLATMSPHNAFRCCQVLCLSSLFCLVSVFFLFFWFFHKICMQFYEFLLLHGNAFGIPVAVISATCLRIKIFQGSFCFLEGLRNSPLKVVKCIRFLRFDGKCWEAAT